MERRATGAGGIPVQRVEMTTRDMDVIVDLINRLYVEHRARFRCLDPARVDAGARAATTGLLEAAVVRYQGFDYHARVSPPDDFFALVTLTGTGPASGLEDLAELEAVALALVQIGSRGREAIERLVSLGSLNPLAHHVDRPDQLPAFRRVFGQHLGHVELALAGLGQQPAADFLGAVVPQARVEPRRCASRRCNRAGCPNHVRLGRLGRQSRQADHEARRRRGPLCGYDSPGFQWKSASCFSTGADSMGFLSFMFAVLPSLMLGNDPFASRLLVFYGPLNARNSPILFNGAL